MSTNTITISLKQLREDFPRVIEEIGKGAHFTVIKRSKPVFEITPIKRTVNWSMDFAEEPEYPDGIPAEALLARMQAAEQTRGVSKTAATTAISSKQAARYSKNKE